MGDILWFFIWFLLAEEIVYHKCAVENGSSWESNSAVTYTQNDMALVWINAKSLVLFESVLSHGRDKWETLGGF